MSDVPMRIESVIKDRLAPMLRSEGFAGSGRTFRRTRNGYIHVVNIQGSRYGGQFTINLAIQPVAVPDVLGNEPDPKKIVESECEFRKRLSETGADQWWKYDDLESLEQAMSDAANAYLKHGRVAFEAMSTSPSPIEVITANQLAEGCYGFNGFGSTKVRMALVLARLREAEGRKEEAVSFAIYGLENTGKAFSLIPELERIAALAKNSISQTL